MVGVEALLSNVAARIILNLAPSVLKEIGLLWGLTNELAKLKRTVSTIADVLLDAEEKSIENCQVKNWLGMLSEAMYDADDLLDEFSTEALRQQVMDGSELSKKVRQFFSSSNQIAFGVKMAHKVKALRERLDEIAANRKFHLEEGSVGRVFIGKGRDQTHSSPPQIVIGREVEKEGIIKDLLSSDDGQENVSVVSVVGIGGLGKTTLAQMVFNDDTVKNHFELKLWICVSDDFDVQKLVEKVLQSATGKKPEVAEMDPLKNSLHKEINGRRYLLVLDDVWNENVTKWFSFKDLLAGGARGSKIVITTRLPKVAELSRPIRIHELRGLSEEEAWSLFKLMALKSGKVLDPKYEAIGREIVAKCCGVPLAIRAIGGMMYSKQESEWELFKNEELSKIDVYKEDFLPILKLSYNFLPSHYKHCFAYCSLYPKDFEIPVEDLIRLWKAQGYLESTDRDECLQEVGYGWFMDLYRLSFFQDGEKDEFGEIKSCKMHDLMHDLAISVAGNNYSSSLADIKDKTQHMSVWVDRNSILQDFSPLLKAAKSIRTVLSLGEQAIRLDVIIKEKELHELFCNLRCLRVLSLYNLNISELPSSIYKLKHLRHLDLSENRHITELPDSITYLLNLQVLKLSGCSRLKQLPDNITKLVNLTDLDNEGCDELTHMPRGIGKLTRLEKLPVFVIAKDNSKHSGGLDELQGLNNLRGELKITNLEYLKNAEFEIKESILSEKKHLQMLTLVWAVYGIGSADDVGNYEMGLEALRPHQNLKILSVWYYRGVRPPSWLPSITNLVSFCIAFCESIKWLPPLDQLPFLKNLSVWGLTKLEHIEVENRGSSSIFFPSLEELTLQGCPNLKGFERSNKTRDVGSSSLSMEDLLPTCFPRLYHLRISGCRSLTYMPLFPEIKELELDGDGVKSLMGVLKMRRTTSSAASESTTSSPFSTLSQLEQLQISGIEDWEVPSFSELLQYLPSLQKLKFSYSKCKSVSNDEEDDAMQWQNLKVLRSVEFRYMENMVCLPKGLQYVTTLQHLYIKYCPSLVSIPEWMANLTALQHLRIDGCPQLSEICNNNTAEDWPNICVSMVPFFLGKCCCLFRLEEKSKCSNFSFFNIMQKIVAGNIGAGES